jgi:hypothetical protein
MRVSSSPCPGVTALGLARLAAALAVLSVLLLGQAPRAEADQLGVNIIVNPGAEAGAGDNVGYGNIMVTGPGAPVSIPGWTVRTEGDAWHNMNVLTYYAIGYKFSENGGSSWVQVGGYPNASTPGPADKGTAGNMNMFYGGGFGRLQTDGSVVWSKTIDPTRSGSQASQVVSLAGYSALIGSGKAAYDLSGWLGGWSTQADSAHLYVAFLDAAGNALGTSATLTSPDGATRKSLDPGGVGTGLWYEQTTGFIPANAAQAKVVLDMI